MKKIFVTGGHVTPALAVIEEIRRQKPDWEVVFIGRKYAFEEDREVSIEYTLVTSSCIRFLPLTTGRLQRYPSFYSLWSFMKIPYGLVQALYYCLREKPNLIISFGGYVALPVVLAGWLCRISSVTHEQTLVSGLANRVLSFFVKKIYVSFKESQKQFPKKKTMVTGLPLRKGLFGVKESHFDTLEYKKFPIVYISGGATGAVSFNDLLFPAIPQLMQNFTVVHQVGSHSLKKAKTIKASLPNNQRFRYIVEPYFFEQDVAWLYRHAKLIICRSGANTITELATFGKVALCIPLPWAASSEQTVNATWLKDHGSAEVLDQLRSNTNDVLFLVGQLLKRRIYFEKKALVLARQMPKDGAHRMVNDIITLI